MTDVGLPEALERAASALPADADGVRPANGDPSQLLELLTPEAAGRVLCWLLEHEPAAGTELVAAWADDPERGGDILMGVDPTGLSKLAAKALRKSHHKLRSRGIAVVAAGPVSMVATLPPIDDTIEAAVVSALDPQGSRVIYLVEPNPGGGARLFAIVLDEQRGVVGCEVFSTTRSKVRQLLRDTAQRSRFPTVEAPQDAVRALVARVGAAQSLERTPPRAYTEWRSHLMPAEGAATPGEIAREQLEAGGSEALTRAVELVESEELGPWPTSPEALQKLAEKIGELGAGRVIVSGQQRGEQVDALLTEGLGEVFAEPFGERTAHAFDESAFVLWKSDRVEDARAALAAAGAFRATPPGENRVARALLERVLAPVLGRLEEEKRAEEQESLLVKP